MAIRSSIDRLNEMFKAGALTEDELNIAKSYVDKPWDFGLTLYEDYMNWRYRGRDTEAHFADAKRWHFANAERRSREGKTKAKTPFGPIATPAVIAGWLVLLLAGYFVGTALFDGEIYETIGTAFDGLAAAALVVGIIVVLRAPRGSPRAGIGCIGTIVAVLVAGGIGTAIKGVPGNRKAEAESAAEDVAAAERMGLGLSSYRKAKEASSDAWSACRLEVVNTGGSDAMDPDIVPNYSWSASSGIIHISGRDMKFRMPGYELPAPYECDYDMATGVATQTR